MDWREYQQQVADVLASLGFETRTDERMHGARGHHDVDVTARYTKAGLEILWIVECKFWRSRVKKANVLTLKAVLDDIGADRGLVLSESGFQRGAFDVIQKTNISLLGLEQLRLISLPEVNSLRVHRIADVATDYSQRLHSLGEAQFGRSWSSRTFRVPKKYVNDDVSIRLIGMLSHLESAARDIERGKSSVAYPSSLDGYVKCAADIQSFVHDAEKFLREALPIIVAHEAANEC
jgi:hypothetical protein